MGLAVLKYLEKTNLQNLGREKEYTLTYTSFIIDSCLIAISNKEPVDEITQFIYLNLLGLFPLKGVNSRLNNTVVDIISVCQPKFGQKQITNKQLRPKLKEIKECIKKELG